MFGKGWLNIKYKVCVLLKGFLCLHVVLLFYPFAAESPQPCVNRGQTSVSVFAQQELDCELQAKLSVSQ